MVSVFTLPPLLVLPPLELTPPVVATPPVSTVPPVEVAPPVVVIPPEAFAPPVADAPPELATLESGGLEGASVFEQFPMAAATSSRPETCRTRRQREEWRMARSNWNSAWIAFSLGISDPRSPRTIGCANT